MWRTRDRKILLTCGEYWPNKSMLDCQCGSNTWWGRQTRRSPSATNFDLAVFEPNTIKWQTCHISSIFCHQANSIEKKRALPTVYITPNYRDKISQILTTNKDGNFTSIEVSFGSRMIWRSRDLLENFVHGFCQGSCAKAESRGG